MKQQLTTLIIEDHPLVSEGYKSVFKKVAIENSLLNFDIIIKRDYDSASKQLDFFTKNSNKLDIVLLDIKLSPSKVEKFLSGEDLGIRVRQDFPNAKLIILTSFYDHLRIQSILKSVNPDGFLIKIDFDIKALKKAVLKVITNPPYYSSTVAKSIKNKVEKEHVLELSDRRLLYELSLGTKMKDLPEILPMSMTSIESRKRLLKQLFNIENEDDRHLILIAKEKGFI